MRRLAVSAFVLAVVAACEIENAPGRSRGAGTTPTNIYAATGKNQLAPAASRARPFVYVPNSRSASVTVIDPVTYQVIRTFSTGTLPQHVVPSYDLGTLWVANNEGNSLTPIDPATGEDGARVPVDDPYNLYFTPDGRFAVVIAERRHHIDFRNAQDMKLVQSLSVSCMTRRGYSMRPRIPPNRTMVRNRYQFRTCRMWTTSSVSSRLPRTIR